MPCSMITAHNEVLALLAPALVGIHVKYPDRPAPTSPFPPTNLPWARVSISDEGEGRLPPLVGELGSRRYTTDGLLIVELYALSGDGRSAAQTLGQTVLAAFRGQKTAGGVWFRRARVNDIGADGAWYHVNAVVEFQYDTVQ